MEDACGLWICGQSINCIRFVQKAKQQQLSAYQLLVYTEGSSNLRGIWNGKILHPFGGVLLDTTKHCDLGNKSRALSAQGQAAHSRRNEESNKDQYSTDSFGVRSKAQVVPPLI